MANPLIFSFPNTLAIFLSGVNHCLASGSCKLFFFKYAHNSLTISDRDASFNPIIADKSFDSLNFLVKAAGVGLFSLTGLSVFWLFFGDDFFGDTFLGDASFDAAFFAIVLSLILIFSSRVKLQVIPC